MSGSFESNNVFGRCMSTGSELFSALICLEATKFVLLSVFTLKETICPRICSKTLPRSAKSPLPVDVRRSKTSLLKLTIELLNELDSRDNDGDGYENVTKKWIRLFQLVQFVKCWQFFLELNSIRLYQSSGKEKESRCLVFTSSTKRQIRHFHVVVVQRRQRSVLKSVMHLFCQSKPIAFLPFSLPSPSSLLKLPVRTWLCLSI